MNPPSAVGAMVATLESSGRAVNQKRLAKLHGRAGFMREG
jgi:hypothetical protein